MLAIVDCTEDEIRQLVHRFYARVRVDPELGPIFNSHIDDWDMHLAKLVDFWSSLLRRTARYQGAPMPRHAALPGLHADLFRRWLSLFSTVAAEQPNQAMADAAVAMAGRIARSLWMGYQMAGDPASIPADLELPAASG